MDADNGRSMTEDGDFVKSKYKIDHTLYLGLLEGFGDSVRGVKNWFSVFCLLAMLVQNSVY